MPRLIRDLFTGEWKWDDTPIQKRKKVYRPHPARSPNLRMPMIMRDLDPYESAVTGETVDGRRAHREHLKQHGCVELGDLKIEDVLKRPSDDDILGPIENDVKEAIELCEAGKGAHDLPHLTEDLGE